MKATERNKKKQEQAEREELERLAKAVEQLRPSYLHAYHPDVYWRIYNSHLVSYFRFQE